MPFKSQAQRAFMYARHPELAREFEAATPKGKHLPQHVGDKVNPANVTKRRNKGQRRLTAFKTGSTRGPKKPGKYAYGKLRGAEDGVVMADPNKDVPEGPGKRLVKATEPLQKIASVITKGPNKLVHAPGKAVNKAKKLVGMHKSADGIMVWNRPVLPGGMSSQAPGRAVSRRPGVGSQRRTQAVLSGLMPPAGRNPAAVSNPASAGGISTPIASPSAPPSMARGRPQGLYTMKDGGVVKGKADEHKMPDGHMMKDEDMPAMKRHKGSSGSMMLAGLHKMAEGGVVVPKGYDKGEPSYKLTSETYFYKKPSGQSVVPKATKPKPMEVKIVGKVPSAVGK